MDGVFEGLAASLVVIACVCPVMLAGLGAVLFIGLAANRTDPETKQAWDEAAARFGLTIKHRRVGYPLLDGEFEGRAVKVRASRGRGGGSAGRRYTPPSTSYTARFNRDEVVEVLFARKSGGPSFSLRKDPVMGYPEFDEAFAVVTAAPDFARAVLVDAGLRARLVQHDPINVHISKWGATISEEGIQRDPDVMREHLRLAVAVAERVERV